MRRRLHDATRIVCSLASALYGSEQRRGQGIAAHLVPGSRDSGRLSTSAVLRAGREAAAGAHAGMGRLRRARGLTARQRLPGPDLPNQLPNLVRARCRRLRAGPPERRVAAQQVGYHPDRREDGRHSRANCPSSGFEARSIGWEGSIWESRVLGRLRRMYCKGFGLLAFLALLLGQSWLGADAAASGEGRIDRNFAAAAVSGPKIQAVPPSALTVSKGRIEVRIGSWDYDLETLTVTPSGAGPFPLAVVSHGTPTRGGKEAKKKTRIRQLLAIAEDFARRGYKAVVFARRGYASSSGVSREGYGRCNDANRRTYVSAARTGAEDFAAVIEAFASQPDVDGSTVIAAGHSGGGFAASALAMDPPPGLVGIINFAGGRGGAKKKGNCSKHGFVHAFGTFGDGAKVPALWLYSTTDRLFWPELIDRALDAYAANGAPVRLERIGALWFSDNGHRIQHLGAREFWSPRIGSFLNAIGAPNWETAPDDVTVARIPPPPGLGSRGVNRWRRYLATSGHKAFAQGEGTRFGWAAPRDTVEEATQAAKGFCEKGGHRCRVVSVDGAMTR